MRQLNAEGHANPRSAPMTRSGAGIAETRSGATLESLKAQAYEHGYRTYVRKADFISRRCRQPPFHDWGQQKELHDAWARGWADANTDYRFGRGFKFE